MEGRFLVTLLILSALSLMCLLVVFHVKPVRSHEWYDPECCSKKDCREVRAGEVRFVEEGVQHIPSGKVFKWGDWRLKPSQDANTHVCLRGGLNGAEAICVYYAISG